MKRLGYALVALAVVLTGFTGSVSFARASTVPLRTVVAFDPTANEFPEGLAADKAGNLDVGLAFTGEIRRIGVDGSQRTLATLPVGQGLLLGLAVDGQGTVYAALGPSTQPRTGCGR